ncbi:MAG TPA: response regulator [Myxococcaceae bacterium]|jgi:DNA-binding response OmpR family regulator|nr:response regulator [Myxococcaceae bacterium]
MTLRLPTSGARISAAYAAGSRLALKKVMDATPHRPVVLISDDEPLMVSALAREARRHGLHFISDTSSEHVHELALRHRPEVIILDINQHIDGRDLLSRLKKDPNTRDCRVIVLTAIEDQFTRTLCLELGADDYETKPVDSTFMTRVARLARAAAARQSRPSQPKPPQSA